MKCLNSEPERPTPFNPLNASLAETAAAQRTSPGHAGDESAGHCPLRLLHESPVFETTVTGLSGCSVVLSTRLVIIIVIIITSIITISIIVIEYYIYI